MLTNNRLKDAKEVIRSRNSKKDRQYNGQEKNDKRTNNDIQTLHRKQTEE